MGLPVTMYYIAVAALFTHEMDAVLRAEWRLLFHLRTLPDVQASAWFIALHFPLFLAFFWLGHHANQRIRLGFRSIVCLFVCIHAVLHYRLSDAPAYAFEGLLSNLWIFGAVLPALGYLALSRLNMKRTP